MAIFVVTTSSGKPDKGTMRKIRSHAMRGRNTRVDRLARAQERMSPDKSLVHTMETDSSASSISVPCTDSTAEPYNGQKPGKDNLSTMSIPRKLAPELLLQRSEVEQKPYMLELIYQGILTNSMSTNQKLIQHFSPAFTTPKPCRYAIDMKVAHESESHIFSLSDMHTHEVSLHSILFTASAFKEVCQGVEFSILTRYHLGETLRCIQQSLQDKSTATAMATVGAIVNLASAASSFGDVETARKHMDGICRIFELRGGISPLGTAALAEMKCQRIEICLSMAEGRKPRLLPNIQSWDSLMPKSSIYLAPESTFLDSRNLTTDRRLLSIWADLQHYSRLASENAPIPPELFLSISTTLPNRLLHLSYNARSTCELLRLCMLVYIKSILFSLPGVGKRMSYLSTNLEMALQTFVPCRREHSTFLLWALLIAGGCIFEDFGRTWHRQAIRETCDVLGVSSWIQCREMLGSVLWIDDLHDSLTQGGFVKVFGAT
ncbi:Fungal transcription factor [Fusarium oxysporum f. sp. vasinfectum]|nr:Fungal transcription factor [Fusarium oxysporum f. sp. vasinfectum]